MRGELVRPTGSTEIGLYGASKFGKGFGAFVYLYFATPSDTFGTAFVIGAGAAGACGSCACVSSAGLKASVQASVAASSGRTNILVMISASPRIGISL